MPYSMKTAAGRMVAAADAAPTSPLVEWIRRGVIGDAAGGTGDHLVLFGGSGSTAAVHNLTAILGLRDPARRAGRSRLASHIRARRRPVVFVGPDEHHSGELPWRESAADVVVIGADADGQIDLADLERRIIQYAARPLLIGSFSAASNVTGILSDTTRIATLLHRYGALSVWDYTTAAPHVPIRMAATRPGSGDHKDAVFLSPHTFIGGPQTPGVLIVRRDLVTSRGAR
jgi:selenocysteine lyase/cysteine desulfurase